MDKTLVPNIAGFIERQSKDTNLDLESRLARILKNTKITPKPACGGSFYEGYRLLKRIIPSG